MTRRIMLPIEGATDTHCGGCPHPALTDESVSLTCELFADVIANHYSEPPKRLPACLAAEAAAARVERDARLGARVRARVENAASDDGTTPLDVAMRFAEKYGHEDTDPAGDVWAVFDAIATTLREEDSVQP
jgi:hypothetical protein